MRRYLIALIAAAFLVVGAAPAHAVCGSSTSTAILGLKKIANARNWWECVDDNLDVLDTQLVVEYVSSTATAGAATTLTDTTQSWSVDLWINKIVKITGGTGSGQSRSIASNTATVLTVASAWDTNPDATSTYKILAGGGVTDHGRLSGLGDDDHSLYHNDARGDARYFQESEFLNTSAGAGDAGKPIKLDAGGQVDATMVNDADVDHGLTTGLGDDDHSLYHTDARGDARYFQESEFLNTSAGAGDAGKPIKLDAGGQVDATMVNDADVDHGLTTGLGDDDHTQYHNDTRGDARYLKLAGGTMTGKITLDADPTSTLHAATKQYVDAVGNITAIGFIIDGGGSAITTGAKGDLRIPFGCTINRATAMADATGSIVVDIWKDTYANFPPTDADSITASAPVTITSANKSEDSTLTGWTTGITADDILRYNVDSASTITRVTVSLKCTKS